MSLNSVVSPALFWFFGTVCVPSQHTSWSLIWVSLNPQVSLGSSNISAVWPSQPLSAVCLSSSLSLFGFSQECWVVGSTAILHTFHRCIPICCCFVLVKYCLTFWLPVAYSYYLKQDELIEHGKCETITFYHQAQC